MDRGYQLCEDEDGNVWLWKRCEVSRCPNLICERRSPRFCWPHSDSGQTVSDMIRENAKKKTKVDAP